MADFLRPLDQPHTWDYDDLAAGLTFPQANSEVDFRTDRDSDLYHLAWAWSREEYAASIQVRLDVPYGDDLTPMAVRFFPGYQETIYGCEGVIVSKRIFAPYASGYDQSVLFMLECQAEGDWLVKVEIDIDWGRPLTQRMVDGLLVAQSEPRPSKGVFGQQNAESTRVFGTTQGRPDFVAFPDEHSAHLVYHVLITGEVELPLILAVSDVGEQLAWNGFLALRDIGLDFRKTNRFWEQVTHQARLWTPSASLNQAVQMGRLAAARSVRRLRTGLSPARRKTAEMPPLLDMVDTISADRSRDLLAHLRQVAERTKGKLPATLPDHPQTRPTPPGSAIARTNSAYLQSLDRHLHRHPDLELLAEHYPAVQACAEGLLTARWGVLAEADATALRWAAAGLRRAAALGLLRGSSADTARWESEAAEYVRLAGMLGGDETDVGAMGWDALPGELLGWLRGEHASELIELAGQVVWGGCGVSWRNGEITVEPSWPEAWGWWALLDLPIAGRSLSVVWDGAVLHSTQPVRFVGELRRWEKIQAKGTDPDAFDLHFEMKSGDERQTLRPNQASA